MRFSIFWGVAEVGQEQRHSIIALPSTGHFFLGSTQGIFLGIGAVSLIVKVKLGGGVVKKAVYGAAEKTSVKLLYPSVESLYPTGGHDKL